MDPEFGPAYTFRVSIKSRLGDNKGAIADYTRVLDLNPDNVIVYNNRGIAKHRLGDREGACPDWNKAVKLGFMPANELIIKYCK